MKNAIKEFLQSLVIAGILAFFIITFVAQSFVVDGRSMANTLQDGERLFVNKFIYRLHPPERGDIVVFSPKGAPGQKYIKRVIGIPGDTIYIKDGNTYINGKAIDEEYLPEKMFGNFGPYEVPKEHIFALGDNRNHSADSRFESVVGFVDYDDISGKAFWVYWPLTEMRVIDHQDYNLSTEN